MNSSHCSNIIPFLITFCISGCFDGGNSNNVLTDTPDFADPENVIPLNRDFSLTATSVESIDTGYEVPIFDDIDGTVRTGIFDVGAMSY